MVEAAPSGTRWGRRARRRLAVGVALGGLLVAVALLATDVLRPLDRMALDARFAVRGEQSARGLLLVGIDDATLRRRGFPLPRRFYGAAIARLHHAGARAIGLDVQISEESDARDDDALIAGLRAAPGTFLSSTTADHGQTPILGGGAEQLARAHVGLTTFPQDPGGTIRRFRASGSGVPTLPAAVGRALGAGATVRGLGHSTWIDYLGGPGHVPEVSLEALLAGRVPGRTIRGRIVVIGATAPSLQDLHDYSTLDGHQMTGAEVELNAISTVLRGAPLQSLAGWLGVLATLLVGVAAPAGASLLRRPGRAVALLLGVLLAWLLVAQLAFSEGRIVPVAAPLATLLLAGTAAVIGAYSLELRARRERLLAARVRAVEAGDQARRRVERDLHDGAQQRLLALAMLLGDPDAEPDRAFLERASEQVMQTLAELRRLARGVYPAALTERGVHAALCELADHAAIPTSVTGADPGRLAPAAEQALYFVAAEGLANAVKHAGARSLELRLGRRGERATLCAHDDGRGGADPTGAGLLALSERVEAAGGQLDVRSPPGDGTRLDAWVPGAPPVQGQPGLARPPGARTVRL